MSTRLRLSAVVAALSLILAVLVASPAEARKRTRGKVDYTTTAFVAGGAYAITGKVKGGGKGRKVLLQVKWGKAWKTIDKTKTQKKGAFALGRPYYWLGSHKARVFVPKTRRFSARAFTATTLSVMPTYAPLGDPAAYNVDDDNGGRNWRMSWDPCKTVGYRVNPGPYGDGAVALSQQAVATIAAATGFTFVYKGLTANVPLSEKRYEKDTDLVIAFAHQDQYPQLTNYAGLGGGGRLRAMRLRKNNKPVWSALAPGVTINNFYVDRYVFGMEAAAPAQPIGKVLVHELGHAFGLDHVEDQYQMMAQGSVLPHADGVVRSTYQAGDLAGFRQVGATDGCFKPWRSGRRTSLRGVPTPPPVTWTE